MIQAVDRTLLARSTTYYIAIIQIIRDLVLEYLQDAILDLIPLELMPSSVLVMCTSWLQAVTQKDDLNEPRGTVVTVVSIFLLLPCLLGFGGHSFLFSR